MKKKLMNSLMIFLVLFLYQADLNFVYAQESEDTTDSESETTTKETWKDKLHIAGYTFLGYSFADKEDDELTFGLNPILLYRINDQLLFESELELEYEAKQTQGFDFEGEGDIELEYAQVDWIANDYITLIGGQFLTPFGVFIEKLHPAWVNKLPSMPLPYGHDASLVPFNQVGVQVRGATPIFEESKINYAVFVSTGPKIKESEEEEGGEEVSKFVTNWDNNNSDIGYGGRIGIVPVPQAEIGVSGFTGNYDDGGDLRLTWIGVDGEYHFELAEIRGEYLHRSKDLEDNAGTEKIDAFYIQGSQKLSIIPIDFFNPLEAIFRYGQINNNMEETARQYTVGLNYAIDSRTYIKVAYERTDHEENNNALLLQIAHGF